MQEWVFGLSRHGYGGMVRITPSGAGSSVVGILLCALSVQVALLACSPPRLLTTRDLLTNTWHSYERDFITSEGQVLNPLAFAGWFRSEQVPHMQTTSEGQGYAMLRAAWVGDHVVFERVWRWTREHLQVRSDHLFAWLWAPDQNDNWGVAGAGSASDADEDVALALIFAGHRWHDPHYLSEARAILDDIWRVEVVLNRGTYYLTAGDWAPGYGPGIVVNPSYLAPYAYRIFAKEDPGHPWAELASSSYRALRACTWALGTSEGVGLPPNWCLIDRVRGDAAPFATSDGDVYGYDAFRVMWRVALDAVWYHSPGARRYLDDSDYLRRQWARHGWLAAEYHHDGTMAYRPWEDPSAYGANIGNFIVTDPRGALTLMQEKLIASYHSRGGVAYWGDRWNYYQQNWAWFGVALASGELPNLAAPR